MAHSAETEIALPPVSTIGVLVKDLDKAIAYYSSNFGIGPFHIEDHAVKAKLHGKDVSYKVRFALAKFGPVMLELLNVSEGESLHLEVLKRKGEGVSFLSFHVEDLPGEIAKFEKRGFKVLMSAELKNVDYGDKSYNLGYAFMDTDKVGGVIFELSQLRP